MRSAHLEDFLYSRYFYLCINWPQNQTRDQTAASVVLLLSQLVHHIQHLWSNSVFYFFFFTTLNCVTVSLMHFGSLTSLLDFIKPSPNDHCFYSSYLRPVIVLLLSAFCSDLQIQVNSDISRECRSPQRWRLKCPLSLKNTAITFN